MDTFLIVPVEIKGWGLLLSLNPLSSTKTITTLNIALRNTFPAACGTIPYTTNVERSEQAYL